MTIPYLSVKTETASLSFTATTWTDVHNVVTLTDRFGTGITRSNSTFTFSQAGTYYVTGSFNAYATAQHLGFRMRRITGTQATLLQRTQFSGGQSTVAIADQPGGEINGLIQVAANDAVSLQYVVTAGTNGTWGATTMNGENAVTGHLEIWKINP